MLFINLHVLAINKVFVIHIKIFNEFLPFTNYILETINFYFYFANKTIIFLFVYNKYIILLLLKFNNVK